MKLIKRFCLSILLLTSLSAFGDETGLLTTDTESLAPMEIINITVHDVNASCTINVLTPTGHLQSFAGTIADSNATASYRPSYLLGLYEVSAVVDGNATETDTFTVTNPNAGDAVQIDNWNVDPGFYRPQENLTFTFDLADSGGSGLTGFAKDLSDTRYDSDSGRLSILRKIMDVAADGTITARVQVYFDTTGRWSNIYAPTTVKLGLYYKDGGPLPGDITLANGTLNDDGGNISSQLVKENSVDKLVTDVVTSFASSDKISYVDIAVPASRSLSEVIFAVEYIKYHYNTGWADRIYISEKYVDASGSGFELDTGDSFSSLGRLPVFLPLTPNENGLVYYSIHSADLPGTTNLNDGSFSQDSGTYTNVWTWNTFVSSTADCYVYADKWGYDSHGFAGPLTLVSDPNSGLGQLRIEEYGASDSSYFPLEDIEFSFLLKDSADANVPGFTGTIADPLPTSDSGAFYVRREVIDVNEDGSSKGRLSVYFDTTGQWSDIYAGTTIEFGVYDRDGLTALTDEIALTTGFINNDGNALSSELTGNTWKVNVDTGFTGKDRIAYLDFDFPGTHSVSDVVVSVDRILYSRNSGWADKIVIANNTISDSAFPINLNGQIEFTTGDSFPGLGRFPLKITLSPNKDGFVFYKFESPDIAENNINYGSLSEGAGSYKNTFKWNDYIVTTARVFPYVDSWHYSGHAVGEPVTLDFNDTYRELGIVDYWLDSRAYTMADTRKLTATVLDGYADPVSGLVMNDSLTDSDSGRLSIITKNAATTPEGDNVVRLLVYFDTSGRWSDIYAGTTIDISVFGPDGKTGVDPNITIEEGFVDANGYIATTLTENSGVYSWKIDVTTNFTGADRQAYLDFICPDETSASNVVFSVDHIKYFCNTGWADTITIRNQSLGMSSFPRNYSAQYEFATGAKFGSLGRFPLYLSLNPGGRTIFPKMANVTDSNDTELTGSMSGAGTYTYSHNFTEVGSDFRTQMCIAQYGYFGNRNLCTEDIMLYFSGEPRYLGGLEDEPVRLGETWQRDLTGHFFIEPNYANVEYSSSDPCLVIAGSIATFGPNEVSDTMYDLVITAQSKTDPCLVASSEPFTLYAAECLASNECGDVNLPRKCVTYQCEYYESKNMFQQNPQGVDLSIFNEDVNMTSSFPNPGEQVRICADVYNKGTAYVYDVNVSFYLDDVNSAPIGANTLAVVPITYFDLPFRYETACIDWIVPPDLSGPHRIWVAVDGNYPLDMQESMLSNNYATLDFFVNDPDMTSLDPGIIGSCSSGVSSASAGGPAPMSFGSQQENCITTYLRIPVRVRVCEEEIVCGPVLGYEYSYWNTWYWPSWSGYCKEFSPGGDALWAFIITYEVAYGIFGAGAVAKPSLTDGYNLLKVPYGWGTGWLPSHPAPTLFPYNDYGGIDNPGDGGICPVAAWDCGEGVHFEPRFDSPHYNAYEFAVVGRGARRMTRCHTETDYMEIPYQICYPFDGSDPPIRIPFNPFRGSPDPNDSGFGPNGSGPPGSPGSGPPPEFTLGPPVTPDGNSAAFECYFCSTGTTTSNSASDSIQCVPTLPYNEVRLRQGWNLWTLTTDPLESEQDPSIPLYEGWNTFGYSSPAPFLWASALVGDGIETKTIEQARQAGWIQAAIYYFDNKTNLTGFVPGDDDSLRTNKAYWLFARRSNLTLTLPGAGGSLASNSLLWTDLNVVYGLETKTLTDAQNAGWLDTVVYYHDANEGVYKSLPADDEYIYPWSAYWIYSSIDGLKLQAPDSNSAAAMLDAGAKAFAADVAERRALKAAQPVLSKSRMTELAALPPALGDELGRPAPDFALPDMAGNLVRLNDQNDSQVLLVFGETSCPHCADKVPLLNKLQSVSEDKNIKVLFVALGADSKAAEDYVSRMNIRFKVLADAYGAAARRYGITKVPEAFLIDSNGVIQYSSRADGQTIWQLLEVRSAGPGPSASAGGKSG